MVRVERDAARGVRRPGDAARGRVGVALVVADRERRAPGDARPGRDDRPVRVPRSSTSAARARSRRCSRSRSPSWTSSRAGSSTRRSSTQRRLQGRPDDHAAGTGALPGRHRRRTRDGRPEVVLGPASAGRLGAAHGRDRGLVHDRCLGPAGARPRRLGDERRRLPRGLSFRALPARSSWEACARWRPGSRTSASSAGSCTRRSRTGPRSGTSSGKPGSRTASCRRASASTGRRDGSRRATGCTAPSSIPSTTSPRPG